MKAGRIRNKLIVMGLLLGMVCSVANGAVTSAKKGKVFECSKLVVADGTKYKISQIAKDTGCLRLTSTGYGRVSLKKLLKSKKVTWTSGNKNLKVSGGSFTAKKPGTYMLTGKVKNDKYQVPLRVVSKKPEQDLSSVSYMTISSGSDGSSVKVSDPDSVRRMCTMVSGAGYTFDYKLAQRGPLVGWSYGVTLYAANGEQKYSLVNSTPGYYYKSDKFSEIHAYTAQLFNEKKAAQNIAK